MKPSRQGEMEKDRLSLNAMICKGMRKAGSPNAKKKAGIPPSLLRYDRLMQDCLGPAHGMHSIIKPGLAGLSHPSDGDYFGQFKSLFP
jgi:hypothetical protein